MSMGSPANAESSGMPHNNRPTASILIRGKQAVIIRFSVGSMAEAKCGRLGRIRGLKGFTIPCGTATMSVQSIAASIHAPAQVDEDRHRVRIRPSLVCSLITAICRGSLLQELLCRLASGLFHIEPHSENYPCFGLAIRANLQRVWPHGWQSRSTDGEGPHNFGW